MLKAIVSSQPLSQSIEIVVVVVPHAGRRVNKKPFILPHGAVANAAHKLMLLGGSSGWKCWASLHSTQSTPFRITESNVDN